jgi:putative acetyltransferase
MTGDLVMRAYRPQDAGAVAALYPLAFPDEDLVPLVRNLLEGPDIVSLVAISGAALAGHVIFSKCGVGTKTDGAALLGPLAVSPDRQRQGVGGALIRAGLRQLEGDGVHLVCVLGDPAYYGRFGFQRETEVTPPYPLPEAWDSAWQSLHLGSQKQSLKGKLSVPEPWRRPALWAP